MSRVGRCSELGSITCWPISLVDSMRGTGGGGGGPGGLGSRCQRNKRSKRTIITATHTQREGHGAWNVAMTWLPGSTRAPGEGLCRTTLMPGPGGVPCSSRSCAPARRRSASAGLAPMIEGTSTRRGCAAASPWAIISAINAVLYDLTENDMLAAGRRVAWVSLAASILALIAAVSFLLSRLVGR
jgi:hypothetical protein